MRGARRRHDIQPADAAIGQLKLTSKQMEVTRLREAAVQSASSKEKGGLPRTGDSLQTTKPFPAVQPEQEAEH